MQRKRAEQAILELLAGGAMIAGEVEAAVVGMGVSRRTYFLARRALVSDGCVEAIHPKRSLQRLWLLQLTGVPTIKHCSKCRQTKPITEFHRSKGKPTAWCKLCYARATHEYYERNKATINRRISISHRARRLGMTYAEYVALPVDPATRCAICGVGPDDSRNGHYSNGRSTAPKRLAIDHDHATGKRRGFLCANCNNGLGRFADDPALLRSAADYLERGLAATITG